MHIHISCLHSVIYMWHPLLRFWLYLTGNFNRFYGLLNWDGEFLIIFYGKLRCTVVSSSAWIFCFGVMHGLL